MNRFTLRRSRAWSNSPLRHPCLSGALALACTLTLAACQISSGPAASSVSTDVSDAAATVTISGAGTYVLSGDLSGQVIVNAPDDEVRLILNTVSITSLSTAAVDIEDADSAVVVLAQGSDNSLTGAAGTTTGDSTTATDSPNATTDNDTATAALYSRDTLIITGTGSLAVDGHSADGIASKNGLAVTSNPALTVTAADDGLRGQDWLLVTGGTVQITAGGDGLKSNEDDDETKGFVAMGEASITIISGDDGVEATTDVTVAGTTLSVRAGGGQSATEVASGPGGGQIPGVGQAAEGGQAPAGRGPGGSNGPGRAAGPRGQAPSGSDGRASQASTTATPDSQPAAQSGDATVQSDADSSSHPKGINAGVAYSQDSGTVSLDTADEGLQAAFPTILGGTLTVTSGDDALNATAGDHPIDGYENAGSEDDDGAYLTITGGTVQLAFASSDGIDSNGSASITAGAVLVSGSAGMPDGAVDVNGESATTGVSLNLEVAAGETLTLTGPDGQVWEMSSGIDASSVTVLGLKEGQEYTLASGSGSASGTATTLGSSLGGRGARG